MTRANLPRVLKMTTAAVAVALSLGACSLPGTDPGAKEAWLEANDPLEPLNRAVFGVNEGLDRLIIGPAAETYKTVMPQPVQDSVQAFTRNLLSPIIIVNELLQGDFDGAIRATGRFLTNTVLGGGGIADVAAQAGLPYEPEDFGQTLAVWGFEPGPYLVLPIVGPSSFRDALGYGVDTLADPVRITSVNVGKQAFPYGAAGAYGLDYRARNAGAIEDIRKNSVDNYAQVRSLYRQHRDKLVNERTETSQPDFPAFEDNAAKKKK